jgi:plastocyanin
MKKSTLLRGFTALVIVLAVLGGCQKDSSPSSYSTNNTPPPPASNKFLMQGMKFSPTSMTVPKGTTITWQNGDGVGVVHTSTSDTPGLWDTGDIGYGASMTTTFNTAGTFTFHCKYHRYMGMTGSITVQ